MRKPPDSIQKHLIVWLTSMIVVLFGLSAVGIFLFMRHSFLQQIDQHLERLAEDFMAETHREPNGTVASEYHELELPDYQTAGDDTSAFYQLRDHQGTTLLKSPSLAGSAQLPQVDAVTERPGVRSIVLPGGQKGRAVFVKFLPKLEPVGAVAEPGKPVFLAMAESTNRLSKTLLILAATLSTTGVILAAATFILAGFFIRRACRPIVELGKLTDDIGPGKMDSRLPVDQAPSELRPLIVHFNQLIERLEEGIARERRFSIDIAHELRTPLAEMQILMEVGANSNYPDIEAGSIEDPQVIYERGEAISRRMRKLIEVLTAIYHGERSRFQFTPQPVDVRSIISDAINVIDAEKRSRISFSQQSASLFKFESDQELLRAILDNLLNNAISHSPSGTPIQVTCNSNGFSIENETSELTEVDLQKFDEPFWQKDSSRAASDRFGLGLALVAVYLRFLAGKMNRSLKDGKLETQVIFPKPK